MKQLLSILRGAFLFSLSMFLVQCASYQDDLKKVKEAYAKESYGAALEALESSAIKTASRNRLLYLFEKAQIYESMGEGKKSRNLLLKADKIVDELYTVSVSKEAATYLFNESAQDYAGEDYEKVAIHTMLALSFLKDNMLSAARVEAKKINSRLNEINNGYDSKSKNHYSEDAFARYLSGMIYESQGEFDAAIIDYRKALSLYEGIYSSEFKTPLPRTLIKALNRLYFRRGRSADQARLKKNYGRLLAASPSSAQNYGELIVIHKLGRIAAKQREEFVTTFGKQILRFSFPIIRPKSFYAFGKTGVQVEGLKFSGGELVQNMDQIAAKTLEDRRLRMILKAGARLVIKGQLSQEAGKRYGPLAELAVNIFGAVTETADTRSWTLLPSQFYVTRTLLEPGNYNIKIFSGGKLQEIKNLAIKSGKMMFMVD